MLLAGDIGGTKTRLAAYELAEGRPLTSALAPVVERTFSSGAFDSLEAIVEEFLGAGGLAIDCAGFGVAGPVIDGRTELINLPWTIEAAKLGGTIGIQSVALINDLEATAYGIAALEAADFLTLNEGTARPVGNAAVIAAGTGLGMAGLFWDGHTHRPFACEGGHADFAPRTALEIELLIYLQDWFGHVSYERILSGPGLRNVYEFLRDTGRGEDGVELVEAMQTGDPSVAITQAALRGTSTRAVQALDVFVSIYGAAAGSLALQMMATGGMYVGGGIAPKIASKLEGPAFMKAFVAKGRLRPLLAAIPVRVILDERAALLGAGRYALLGRSREP